MRAWPVVLAAVASSLSTLAIPASADEPGRDDVGLEEHTLSKVPADWEHLVLDTGRAPPPLPEPDLYRLTMRGEHQLRYLAERSFPLVASASAAARQPGLTDQSLGQKQSLSHWLRVTPRLQLKDTFEVVAQVDVLTGMIAADDKARDVNADYTPRNAYDGFSNIQLRWLYAQYTLPWATVRLGQQPNHWGMGILTNDGDHPSLFGDYRYGVMDERILFATKPGGPNSDFNVALAGDLVYRDQLARLTRGQHALQAVLETYWERGPDTLGVYAAYRHQTQDETSTGALAGYTSKSDRVSIDVHGRVVKPIPSDNDAFLYAEVEAAYVLGSTDDQRSPDQGKSQLRSYGGAAKLGVVHRKWVADEARKKSSTAIVGEERPQAPLRSFGNIVGEVEVGYASGDAAPYDGTDKRFTFDPNHKVGLLLFDEILRWQTARSATAAVDPSLGAKALVNGASPPSNGGVFGASYINPTATYRPWHWLDLKGGMVVAQSTSDVVDPYRVLANGAYTNYRGGNPKRKDLGLELDAGFEARRQLDYGITAQAGAQAGILFPGGALEDANGSRLPTQWIFIGRLGLLF